MKKYPTWARHAGTRRQIVHARATHVEKEAIDERAEQAEEQDKGARRFLPGRPAPPGPSRTLLRERPSRTRPVGEVGGAERGVIGEQHPLMVRRPAAEHSAQYSQYNRGGEHYTQ